MQFKNWHCGEHLVRECLSHTSAHPSHTQWRVLWKSALPTFLDFIVPINTLYEVHAFVSMRKPTLSHENSCWSCDAMYKPLLLEWCTVYTVNQAAHSYVTATKALVRLYGLWSIHCTTVHSCSSSHSYGAPFKHWSEQYWRGGSGPPNKGVVRCRRQRTVLGGWVKDFLCSGNIFCAPLILRDH